MNVVKVEGVITMSEKFSLSLSLSLSLSYTLDTIQMKRIGKRGEIFFKKPNLKSSLK